MSRSLWHIASLGCKILGGVFFDDFPIVEPEPMCALATRSFEGLLKALGWRYADVLGARINVGGLHGNSLVIQNKPGRLAKIDALLKEVQEEDQISRRTET